MNRINQIFTISLFIVVGFANGQTKGVVVDSLKRARTRYDFNDDKTLYGLIQSMIKVNDPAFFFGYGGTRQRSNPNPDFRLDQGELRKSSLEMRLAQRFVFFKGNDSKSKDFWMLSKMSVNFDFQYRVGKKEIDPITNQKPDDSPGHPLNTKFGLTLFEHAFLIGSGNKGKWIGQFLDKQNQSIQYRKQSQRISNKVGRFDEIKPFDVGLLDKGLFKKNNLRVWVPRLDLMHYSNGQDTGAVLYNPYPTIARNDYIKGNFSTNYAELSFSYFELDSRSQLLSATAGLRADFPLTKWLTYEKKQIDRYGYWRLNTNLHYRSRPISAYNITDGMSLKERKDRNREMARLLGEIRADPSLDSLNRHERIKLAETRATTSPKGKIRALYEFALTFSSEKILDETPLLADLPRFSYEIKLEVIPLFFRSTYFGFSYYRGRDYLNIRYDLPVSIFKGNLTFRIDGFRPVLF